MADIVYRTDVFKPHTGAAPLISLSAYDRLWIRPMVGQENAWFESWRAPFVTMGGHNVINNYSHLVRLDDAGAAFFGRSDYNKIINHASLVGAGGAIFLEGYYNGIINNFDIRTFAREDAEALRMIGDVWYITNNGLINGSAGNGVNVTGSRGAISSYDPHLGLEHAGVVIGEKVAVNVTGSHNGIHFLADSKILTLQETDGTSDTDGVGNGLVVTGDDNAITTGLIRAGNRAIDVSGDRNTLYLYKDAYNSGSTITAKYGVVLKGVGNTLTSNASIDASSYGIWVQEGDAGSAKNYTVTNQGSIKGLTGVYIEANNGSLENKSIIRGDTGIVVSGTQSKIENKGVIEAADGIVIDGTSETGPESAIVINSGRISASDYALLLRSDNFDVQNQGSMIGDVEVTGDAGNLVNTGLLSGGIALTISGLDSKISNRGKIFGKDIAVDLRDNTSITNNGYINHDGLAPQGQIGIVLKGRATGIKNGSTGYIGGAETAILAEDDTVWIRNDAGGVIQSGDILSPSVGPGALGATPSLSDTGIKVRGNDFLVENYGRIRGSTAIEILGSYGSLLSYADSSIIGTYTALKLGGFYNTVESAGVIHSESEDALIINGEHHKVTLKDVSSTLHRAINATGNHNEIEAKGNIKSANSVAVQLDGNSNNLMLGGSCEGAAEAILVSGNSNTITNNGSIYTTYKEPSSTTPFDTPVITLKSYASSTIIWNHGSILANPGHYAIYQADRYSEPPPEKEDGTVIYNHGVIQGLIKLGSADDIFENSGRIDSPYSGTRATPYDVDLGNGGDSYTEIDTAISDGIKISGGNGNDLLRGGASNNVFYGGNGVDILSGGVGDDTLSGGMGFDTILGGEGSDTFVFDADPFGSDVVHDLIDFVKGEDLIALSGDVFRDLKADSSGHILESQIFNLKGPRDEPETAEQRLIYNRVGGVLMYDPDGSGAAEAQTIAFIKQYRPNFRLHSADFILV